MEKDAVIQLTIASTPMVYVPGVMNYAQNVFAGDRKHAIELVSSLFNNAITEAAVIRILTGDNPPICDPQVISEDETYQFRADELAEETLQQIELDSFFNQ